MANAQPNSQLSQHHANTAHSEISYLVSQVQRVHRLPLQAV